MVLQNMAVREYQVSVIVVGLKILKLAYLLVLWTLKDSTFYK